MNCLRAFVLRNDAGTRQMLVSAGSAEEAIKHADGLFPKEKPHVIAALLEWPDGQPYMLTNAARLGVAL